MDGDSPVAEMFLRLENISGESLNEDHTDEIEISLFTWDINNNANLTMSQQEATSKAIIGNIFVHKGYDKASVTLTQFCIKGQHIGNATITCRKQTGEEKLPFFIVKMKNVMVKSVKRTSNVLDLTPETIELNFEEFHMEYLVQSNRGYQSPGGHPFGWNIPQMKEV